ncbi:TetR/AcrR family transcriptional regulator [Sphingopyxis sp. XHP0097]|uniref:TetR/AcrR family transcriptional regulator n=1 Tax=Sphingopyxis jiangsuensis TaxID=2871171 RepID=A0ABS7MAV8_9SPHN|nr:MULTISPECIES: TetR/AcrR family transcriptional regulator [Sphingopyxis]MBL0768476.1 TetR/AcrR family transcriptional regulator [Sphingopyxis lutea]MBY4635809.1 TetR/AcrR family transcriptional regulator [Sphingopyxis jiangsuensis]
MAQSLQSRISEVAAPARVDGRRERGRSSRRRIVKAMMTLIAGGDLMPSAARVAEEAGLGLRTVFRHFDDMDALYAEISATIAERVLPIVTAPYDSTDWRVNLRDLVERRARVFETMLPFRLAANIKRYQSPFLTAQYGKVVAIERDLVLRLLPKEMRGRTVPAEALCAALSFQNWRALRHDHGMSVEAAGNVTAHMAEALAAALAAGE